LTRHTIVCVRFSVELLSTFSLTLAIFATKKSLLATFHFAPEKGNAVLPKGRPVIYFTWSSHRLTDSIPFLESI